MNLRFCAALALLLAGTSSAAASPPPDATQRVALCNSGYFAEMSLDFGNTGTTATLVSKGHLVQGPFSPFPPKPPYFNVYASASHRASTGAPWTTNEQQVEGHDAYPNQAVRAQKSEFRSPSCSLSGYVMVSVHCPQGNWEHKTLERTWEGCGL